MPYKDRKDRTAHNKRYRVLHRDRLVKACRDYYAANAERLRQYKRDQVKARALAEAEDREAKRKNRLENLSQTPQNIRLRKRYQEQKAICRVKGVINTQARRARLKSCGGRFTYGEWSFMKRISKNRCLRCQALGVTVDHIVPLVLKGTHEWDNIQPLCSPCNSGKHFKTTDYRPAWWPKSHTAAYRLAIRVFGTRKAFR